MLPGAQMFLCQTCLDAGYEPRGYLIIASRQPSNKANANKWIKKRKYIGDPILAEELM